MNNITNLWHQAGTEHNYPQLTEDLQADVLVVGAGFSGLSTALHLARKGVAVVVLEAQQIGFGASGRNVGLTNAGLWIMPQQAEQHLGRERGQALNQLLIDAPLYVQQLIEEQQIDCDFSAKGTLHLAHKASALDYLAQRAEQLSSYGAQLQLLDADDTFNRTRAKGYYGALLDNRAGTLQPLKYCRALAQLAVAAGVKIFTHSPVTGLQKSADKVQANTLKGKITAEKIVLATNAYEDKLSQNRDYYTPLHFCQLASAPLSAQQRQQCLPDNNGCWDTGAVMRSFRTDAAGRLIVGTVGDIHSTDAGHFKRWSQHVVAKTFPQIGALEYQYAWSGRIAKSHNNIPQLLEIEDNIIQIMGYSGRGIAGATVCGRELAKYINGDISRQQLAIPFNTAQKISFNQLRAVAYELGSQLSHLSDHMLR